MDIGKGLSRSFDAYIKNFVPLLLASLVVVLIAVVAAAVLGPVLGLVLGWAGRVGWLLISLLLGAAVALVASPFAGGFIALAFKALRGQKGEFTEVFGHFGKALPVAIILVGAALLSFVVSVIGGIPVLGYLLTAVFGLASPALVFVFGLALAAVVDKGTNPLDALRQAVGHFLKEPLMCWLYGLIFCIVAGIGLGLGFAIAAGLGGLFWLLYIILALLLAVPLAALTLPVMALGLAAAHEEAAGREPAQLKLDRQAVQIAGLVLAGLLVVGLVCNLAGWGFGWGWGWGLGGGRFLSRSFLGSAFGRGLGVSVKERGGKFTIRGKGGSLTVGAGLPSNFPKDIPIYPRAKVEGTLATEDGSMTTFASKDAPDKIFVYYQEELEGRGWTIETLDLGEVKSIGCQKGEREGSVSITKTDEGSTIMISIGKKKE
ncbi:MAG: hypothetical protein ACM3X6_07265 [Patescibacteria group bacterium]